MSTEATVTCPSCKVDFKLTESLAAPLIEATRRQFEQKLVQQNSEIAKREKEIKTREEQLAKEKELIDSSVAEKIKLERAKIASDEAKKAKLALADDLAKKDKDLADVQELLKQKNDKLAEAQKAQAEVVKQKRELEDEKRAMDLTIEKRITESLGKTRELAKKEAEEAMSLKVSEKELTIQSLQKSVDDLKRRLEQGSQQIQGEVLELQLEGLLGGKFPHDLIEPVPKGEHGGDILHRVMMPTGTACGTILWESKRTKNWSDSWLTKLREDQRQAKAEIAIIVSAVLPKGVETFDQIDSVWVVHPKAILPVAMSLRHMLIEVNCARQAGVGQQTKQEMTYHYITGPKFRLRVQAIVESFSSMTEDLAKERKAMTKQWAKRDEQIIRAMEATVGMYGELQGIAGHSLKEIDGLELDESVLALPST